MYERLDEKGKLFTPKVRTAGVEVDIATAQGVVHGYVHVKPEKRVTDELNNAEEAFLAVTNATLRAHHDDTSRQVEFVAVNKRHIISLVPINEPQWSLGESEAEKSG